MTDETVIKRISSGDEKALAAIMDKYSRLLWKCASSVLGSSEADIEECVADVFISIWRDPRQYDPGRGKLSTLLCTMARSRALDRLRSIRARREESSELLPEKDREIVKRRYYHEQKPAEIAKDMGMDKKKVENRLFRSKQKLKGMLKDIEAY